jgi:ribosome maturation factor RimP
VIHQELETLLAPVVEDLGCELWACEYIVQGRYSTLRIYIDKSEGISIDDCERVSREVSILLDVQLPITGQYTLEVSSPGLDRPLFKDTHFQRYLGSRVAIKVRNPIEKRRKFLGELIEVQSRDGSSFITVSENNEQVTIPLMDIVKANLVI